MWKRALVILAAATAVGVSGPAVAQAGTSWAWGYGRVGQLGQGLKADSLWPVQMVGLADVAQVSGGLTWSLARRSDGTVWTCGSNAYGQLGDGTTTERTTAVQVVGLIGVAAAVCGGYHGLAIMPDGTVRSWGSNTSGQLGDGTRTLRTTPVQVVGLTNVIALAGGSEHSLALRSDGTIWAWGHGMYGELGDGTYVYKTSPVQVLNITNAVAIACGAYHSLAVLADGTVRAWGYNNQGQLGDGSITNRAVPVPVATVAGARAVAGGGSHSMAVTTGGSVWAWGDNSVGQIGDASTTDRRTPVPVTGLGDVAAVDAGDEHSIALGDDGVVWTWGQNGNGQLGDGTTHDRSVPAAVGYLAEVPSIAAGWRHSLATAPVVPTASAVTTTDVTGTITDSVVLQARLIRASNGVPVAGRAIRFLIDGVWVGVATTDVQGRAALSWSITDGPAHRTIEAWFEGDPFYAEATGAASLTALTCATKLWGADRAGRITETISIPAYLWRLNNTAVAGKDISFVVDGTAAGTAKTSAAGRAQLWYVIPDAGGAGTRQVAANWTGDGGYRPSSCTSTLYVQRAMPYIWILPKSVPLGATVSLYAYFRRLNDYQKQAGKVVTFAVDGTTVQTLATDANGAARCVYQTVEPVGDHTVRCEFAGDAWVEAGSGEGLMRVY